MRKYLLISVLSILFSVVRAQQRNICAEYELLCDSPGNAQFVMLLRYDSSYKFMVCDHGEQKLWYEETGRWHAKGDTVSLQTKGDFFAGGRLLARNTCLYFDLNPAYKNSYHIAAGIMSCDGLCPFAPSCGLYATLWEKACEPLSAYDSPAGFYSYGKLFHNSKDTSTLLLLINYDSTYKYEYFYSNRVQFSDSGRWRVRSKELELISFRDLYVNDRIRFECKPGGDFFGTVTVWGAFTIDYLPRIKKGKIKMKEGYYDNACDMKEHYSDWRKMLLLQQ